MGGPVVATSASRQPIGRKRRKGDRRPAGLPEPPPLPRARPSRVRRSSARTSSSRIGKQPMNQSITSSLARARRGRSRRAARGRGTSPSTAPAPSRSPRWIRLAACQAGRLMIASPATSAAAAGAGVVADQVGGRRDVALRRAASAHAEGPRLADQVARPLGLAGEGEAERRRDDRPGIVLVEVEREVEVAERRRRASRRWRGSRSGRGACANRAGRGSPRARSAPAIPRAARAGAARRGRRSAGS